MTNPWAFGWGPLLTIIGFLITVGIAGFGFRSFDRWHREKIEEKKLDIAIEAMALAYEAKYVFDTIRSPLSFAWEAKEMPRSPDETDDDVRRKEPYFAILARVERNKEFFERLFKLQPRFMALFGAETEAIFMRAHSARRIIEVSASQLMRRREPDEPLTEQRIKQREQWECDIWSNMGDVYVAELPDALRVDHKIRDFRDEIVAMCSPSVARRR